MPAGKWTPTLNISEYGFVEWPNGTLELETGEKMLWVEAWVSQSISGAVQMTFQAEFEDDPESWTADQVRYPVPWTEGTFTGGAALGTAIAISLASDGKQQFYWWIQDLELVEPEEN
jgi:hypothetical protein